jgi:hypothetical protein
MSNERDPRVDPRPGDVIAMPSGTKRIVLNTPSGLPDGWLRYRATSDMHWSFAEFDALLLLWRDDCAGAVVVKVAE